MPMNLRHLCPRCYKPRSYSYRFDAMFCDHCDLWLEDCCPPGSKPCIFCDERPAIPSQRESINIPITTAAQHFQPD
jgi:hypothetical protein